MPASSAVNTMTSPKAPIRRAAVPIRRKAAIPVIFNCCSLGSGRSLASGEGHFLKPM